MSASTSSETLIWTLLPMVILLTGAYWFLRSLFAVRRSPVRASVGICSGTAGIMSAIALYLLIFNFYSYERLTAEHEIAEISFRRLGPQVYEAQLQQLDELPRHYVLYGDEWQIDARIVKWKPWALLLGLDTYYQLERLSGRYRDTVQETSAQRSVISLNEDAVWQEWRMDAWEWDLWSLAREHPQWLPLLDASYGSATYLPMDDGRRYIVSVTSSGLIARPVQGIL